MKRLALALLLPLLAGACIAPSVVDPADRARSSAAAERTWRAASAEDLPGIYISSNLTGALSNVLLKVIYRFDASGNYSGAALLNDATPHFEVMTGTWNMNASELTLDAAPPAQVEVSDDHSIRITGEQGQVVLRRELNQ